MKKEFLIFILLYSYVITYSQNFTVTPEGLRDSNDLNKTFVVLQCEGLTASQLYTNAIKYINQNYKSPDDVMKGKTENEYLKFETYAPDALIVKNGPSKFPFDYRYQTELSFKDGKVKMEIIELSMHSLKTGYDVTFTGSGLNYFVYNKRGELSRDYLKEEIETYFNSHVLKIKEGLKGIKNDNW